MAISRRRESAGNYISEWFGYRIYPQVTPVASLTSNTLREICPFLTRIKDEPSRCIKRENRTVTEIAEDGTAVRVRSDKATGVCTINSNSDVGRRDWVACPYRILDIGVIEQCVRRLFSLDESQQVRIVAAPALVSPAIGRDVREVIDAGGSVYVFFEQRMGGEVSIPPTDGSPELAFDLTLAELIASDSGYDVRRYGIIELQTADFHGSPSHAVQDLRHAADLFSHDDKEFAAELQKHPEWLSNRVEGPNISNIFKRTFYQMMFKFQLVKDKECAGCVLIVPMAVWDSWQRHLGKPELVDSGEGIAVLSKPDAGNSNVGVPSNITQVPATPSRASWIYVVEPQADGPVSPNPLAVRRVIATDAPAFSYWALERAPEIAVRTSSASIMLTLRHRLRSYWSGLGSGHASRS